MKINSISPQAAKQKAFTLIELIVVIVILGILAATALPRFINLADDAANSGAQGVAGAISSASSLNFADRSINAANGTAITSGTSTCADLDDLLAGGALPNGYTFVNDATVITCANPAGAGGTSTACEITHAQATQNAAITAICTN